MPTEAPQKAVPFSLFPWPVDGHLMDYGADGLELSESHRWLSVVSRDCGIIQHFMERHCEKILPLGQEQGWEEWGGGAEKSQVPLTLTF